MSQDRIFLEDLEARCIIGIFDWERKIRQRILVDLDFPADIRKAARRDRIEDATNYKDIAKRILAFITKSRYQLIETMAEELAGVLLKEFRLKEVHLRIKKPGAVRGSKTVGIDITRKASPLKSKGKKKK